ncbi:hypothetical protein [Streptomyces antibioticus]
MTATQPAPDRTPQPNRILTQPATIAACRRDYQAAADIRARITTQEARHP